jgi:hypothetical protein
VVPLGFLVYRCGRGAGFVAAADSAFVGPDKNSPLGLGSWRLTKGGRYKAPAGGRKIGKNWDWPRFADECTEDASYVDHVRQTSGSREHSRVDCRDDEHLSRVRYARYRTSWHAIDDEKGWVFCEVVTA